jgi:hypothetical protein
MTAGVVDSTVIIHLFRKNLAARAWINMQPSRLLVTPITWLEVMHGAPGKSGQMVCKAILSHLAWSTSHGLTWIGRWKSWSAIDSAMVSGFMIA